MYIESLRLRNYRSFGDKGEVIRLDPRLTALIGSNGAGKTAIVSALQKLFGATAADRKLTREDVHFGPFEEPGPANASASGAGSVSPPPASDEDAAAALPGPDGAETQDLLKPVSERELEIEVILAFPELEKEATEDTSVVPQAFRSMSASGPGEPLKARIRLEGVWKYGVDEDDISTRVYWITSLSDVPFGERDISKVPFSAGDRKRFSVRYLPATRDGAAIIRQALRELLAWLEKYGDWSGGREPMASQWQDLQNLFDSMPAIEAVTQELATHWALLFDGPHLKEPRLTVLAREIQRALRDLTLTLGPGPSGRHRSVHELSEGQASLFYISLVITLLRLDRQIAGKAQKGFKEVESLRPWLTIIVLEEPENHLAPFYLSRMLNMMLDLTEDESAMGIITSHSPATVRRVTPQQVRHVRLCRKELTSHIRSIELPPAANDQYKFVQEAVQSHPELYFSHLVVLGEGRSEQIVLPLIARAHGKEYELDPSFVAFVPLGGRHVNHFWRLLHNLEIPFLTLLDYDLGRHGGGPLRIKYAVDQLALLGVTLPLLHRPADADGWKALPHPQLVEWAKWLRTKNVFYSAKLDLDMMLLRAFRPEYGIISGVNEVENAADYSKAVFGEKGQGLALYPPDAAPSQLDLARYDALFKSSSKPVSHIQVLSSLAPPRIREGCPEPLKALLDRARTLLSPPTDDAESVSENLAGTDAAS
jgi:putative ATP-dependent endonuclease of OLD family